MRPTLTATRSANRWLVQALEYALPYLRDAEEAAKDTGGWDIPRTQRIAAEEALEAARRAETQTARDYMAWAEDTYQRFPSKVYADRPPHYRPKQA